MISLVDLLFPSFCPHCDKKKGRGFLCASCSEEIDLNLEEPLKPPSLLNDSTYCLELEGSNETLHRLFTKRYTSLTDPLSMILYAKMLKLGWPEFQLILPLCRTQSDRLLSKGLQRQLKMRNDWKKPYYTKNIVIVSTLYDVPKLHRKAVELSQYLPNAIFAISLWNC